jgi:class 3 adenylate cyclase/tetratricopeptide (TPR) repeat protein
MVTCSSCGQENPEGFKFCGNCGAALGAVTAPREMRKTVTVVFSDVTGSTALGERLDPESLRRVMGRYFDEMKGVVEGHGGTVEKFIGDAVMAVFGIPVVHEDDALRAVRAAAEMRERLAELNEELERQWGVRIDVRTGVNTGEVVAGEGSGAQRLATGDAVNVAKRFEEAAAAGGILLGETTYRLVRDAVEVVELEALELKGKTEPARAYRLVSIEPGAAGRARQLDSPMVGRERERALLEQAYERAATDRACHLFTILGAAGVGKSRLIAEFLGGVGDSATVVSGRCLPYGVGITFWPLLEVLRSLVGEESVAAIGEALRGREDAALIADRIGSGVGLTDTPGSTEETFWGTRKLFEAVATDHPLVVVFDDLQWGEATFLDLVEHVADWSRDAAILLVCLARPELLDERPGWGGGKLNATSVLLERLNDDESAELVGNLLGRAGLAESVRARISEAAEGNPLFVEEMLAMLIDDGLLERSNGDWVPTGDIDSVSVPPTIQALLAARLDRLSHDERSTIERASVEGKVFHRGGVVELSPADTRDSVTEHLKSLVRKELIRPDSAQFATEDAFRFRHLLIRDAAYDGMPKELRAELHERFAGWLESAAGEHRSEYEELLGYHLEQAYRYRIELAPADDAAAALAERAAGWFASAGMRADARSDDSSAAKLLGRAVSLLPHDAPLRAEVLPVLARSLFEIGDFDAAAETIGNGKDLARRLDDAHLETRLAMVETVLLAQTSPEYDMREMGRVAEAAIATLESLGDDRALAEAYALRAKDLSWNGQYAASEEAFEQAIAHARRVNDRQLEMDATGWIALNYALGGIEATEGIARIDAILESGRDVEGTVIASRGLLLGLQGRFDEALVEIAAGRNMYLDLGATLNWAGTSGLEASLHLLHEDPQAAEAALRVGLEELRRIGETGFASTLSGLLAAALYEQGRHDEAYAATEECRLASAEADIDPQILWRRIRAKILARRGSVDEAETLTREALARVAETEMLDHYAGALLDLADVLGHADRLDEARDLMAEALAVYERRGNLVGAEHTRKLLAETS